MVKRILCDLDERILPFVQSRLFLGALTEERLPPREMIHPVRYDAAIPPQLSTQHIADCGTVGASSVQLAGALGFRRIVLLGFDADYALAGQDPRADHFHPEYRAGIEPLVVTDREFMLRGWESIARLCGQHDIRIVNASRKAGLVLFPQMPIEEALAWLRM
jgi:hypothetical protein